ncbi:DUF3298 and DUF4163 domain-containing protein [Hymenobacter wooponensis]|uniref:DUF3298 domain-containing protein n=1 Tax=Hymenobacter wooponensis TaxID=1525360 RepID=A0A4Z0MGI5_9BACT|nr:DUF3298 and DUF4163 domain-containing protein [Hymenobacter wooponensis]TGD78853.1 DUF3298 domain-containing protein [Hymenobacter wooponensis]
MSYKSRFRVVAVSWRLVAASGLGLFITACQSKTDTVATTATTLDEKQSSADASADSPGAWYRQYRALLPGSTDSITLHLQSFIPKQGSFATGRIMGYYASSDGHPYELWGEGVASSPDSLILTDGNLMQADEGAVQPTWRLKYVGTNLQGTRAGQAVQLRLLEPPEGIRFITRAFSDSIPARPNHTEDSILGRIRLHGLLPVSGTAQQPLQKAIVRGLRHDTVEAKPVPTLADFWRQQRSEFAKDYQEEVGPQVANAKADTTSDYSPVATLNYERENRTLILWNQGNLLSLGFFMYSYSGGAHGNYGTTVRSYDARTGRPLRYQDIFRANSEKQLEKLLGQYARPVLGLKPNQPLSDALFENTLPATHNVYLTSSGAVFVYAPYEVASFAQGEIHVFVPFSTLQPLLQPGLPVAGGPEVVRK